MPKSAFITPAVQEYIIEHSVREDPVLRDLRMETSRRANAMMEIGPEQASFMQLLALTAGVKRYLEIGVFTGYSSLAMALAMPPDGKIVACDVSEEYTAVARRYWQQAGVAGKIDLRLGPARTTLAMMIAEKVEPFDMAFIDADKENAVEYYEDCLTLVRPGGLVLIDNVLWGGSVADSSVRDAQTEALRRVVMKASHDDRVDVALVPTCDGILVARKR
jgi:predicted O-methyltransferase YrrM